MISIRKLCKAFTVADGKVAALKSLDLEVAEGDFFVIVGASGSGKTTSAALCCGTRVAGRRRNPYRRARRLLGQPADLDTASGTQPRHGLSILCRLAASHRI